MSTNTKNRRIDQLAGEQKLIDGTKQFLWQLQSIPVGSQMMTPPEIAQVLEDRIAKAKAAVAAADAHTAAVKADRDERKKTAPFVSALVRIVVGMFSQSPDTLGVFGLKAPRAGKRTVAVKSVAVAKVVATRKARHTMGTKQRKTVKGTVPSANTGSAPAAASPSASTGSEPSTAASPSANTGSAATGTAGTRS